MAEQSQITGAVGGAAQGAQIGSVAGPYGAVIGGVIGAVGGFLSGGGEEEARELAEAQAREIRIAARENRRRQMRELRMVSGENLAREYASGLQPGGSMTTHRREVEAEMRRQIDWDFSASERQAQQALKGGNLAASQISRAGVGSMVQGVGSLGAAYAGGSFKGPRGGLTEVEPQTRLKYVQPQSGPRGGMIGG